jgi:hypothetical protein
MKPLICAWHQQEVTNYCLECRETICPSCLSPHCVIHSEVGTPASLYHIREVV